MNLNGVKSFLRNVLDDLVEKRLWPVAAGLVAALVAVPLLLGGGSSAKPAAAPAPAPATASGSAPVASQALVSLTDTSTATKAVNRPGPVRNPFRQLHQPKPAASAVPGGSSHPAPAAAAAAAPSASTHAGSPAPAAPVSNAGGSAPATSAPAPATTAPPAPGPPAAPSPLDVYRVQISFGPAGQQRKVIDNIPRLLSLPSLQSPLFVYFGVTTAGKGPRAVFLTDPASNPTGDGRCIPSPSFCELVEMKAGDVESFTVPAPPATATPGTDTTTTTTPAAPAAPTGYTLRVRTISRTKAATKAAAARAHQRKSLAGAAVLGGGRSDAAKRRLRYSFALGLLLPVPHRAAVRAEAAGGPVLSSIGQAVAALPVAAPAPAP